MSAKPTVRVHVSREPEMTPTVMLPILSLANSAETSESTASIPLIACPGRVWQFALVVKPAQHAAENINTGASAARTELRPRILRVVDAFIEVRAEGVADGVVVTGAEHTSA